MFQRWVASVTLVVSGIAPSGRRVRSGLLACSRDGTATGEVVTMATPGKSYIVEDVPGPEPKTTPGVFPGTLQGLLDALDAGSYRSAAGSPKRVVIAEGHHRQVIRRFEGGREVWSASRAEIRRGAGRARAE
jgi:hypothetical protein